MIDGVDFLEVTNASGIYCIHCQESNAWYVGQSVNMKNRKLSHLGALRSGVHGSSRLQNIYNLNSQKDFVFHALEYCETEVLTEREQYWYDCLKFSCGLDMLNFGDSVTDKGNRTNHPATRGIYSTVKGGRTKRNNFAMTPEDFAKLQTHVKALKISLNDWLADRIKEIK